MRESSKKLKLLSALVVALIPLSLAAPGWSAPPAPPVIQEGTDCWHTPGPNEAGADPMLITEQQLATLPAGFFGDDSMAVPKPTVRFEGVPLDPKVVEDPFPQGCGCPKDVTTKITWKDRHGNTVKNTRHAVQQVVDKTTKIDTCVRRTKNATFKGQGVAVKVDIQLVKLSLKSVTPLEVSFKSGAKKKYDVTVKESGPQDIGTLTFTPNTATQKSGNVKLGNLHITYDVTFTEQGGTFKKTLPKQKLTLLGTEGVFTTAP